MESDHLRAKYIYGIINSNIATEFNAKGIRTGSQVELVPFKDISAIISDTHFEELDPIDEYLLAHESVLQEALIEKSFTVAPMRFCTILKNKEDVRKLLYEAYLPFKRNLLKVKDKAEIGVKVFVDLEKIEQIFQGQAIEKTKKIAEKFFDELKNISIQSHLEELATDDMIMNASFLVYKSEGEALRKKVIELDEDYTELLKVKIHGPSAAYNFVAMPEVKKQY